MPTELPNLGIAIRDYLKDSVKLVAELTNTDYDGPTITVGWPRDKNNKISVPNFKNIVVILPGRGGAGDIGLGQEQERVDIQCYGANDGKCWSIWRALDYYIYPRYERKVTSFTRKGCCVSTVIRESGALKLVDANASDWPYVSASYIFTYSAV